MRGRDMAAAKWRWVEGSVNTGQDHVAITYGKIRPNGPIGRNDFTPVALVAAPRGKTFEVQFLVKGDSAKNRRMLAEVRKELDYYLVELTGEGRPLPWQYVQYHCGTAANLCSTVHWNFMTAGT